MELQSWTESWKWNSNPPPPKKAKMHHFPILVWRGGGINFASIRTNIEDSIAEYLILITQDGAMKFLPQAAQYHGHLWGQNHDDKLVTVSGIFSSPG